MTSVLSAREAAEAFCLPGDILDIRVHGDGLIHETFVVYISMASGQKRYILQCINQNVFPDPAALMENVERVVGHVQGKAIQVARDPKCAIPSLVRARSGRTWIQAGGQAWRVFQYVEGTKTVAHAATEAEGYQIAKTFGRFLDDTSDLSPQLLRNALPGYRDTEQYLAALWGALDGDPLNRGKDVHGEVAFIEVRAEQAMQLQRLQRSGQLPLRVIHGDTKLNNVLLDVESGDGVCAIDLDTVMPGLLLHDIGDCLREALAEVSESVSAFSQQELRLVEAVVSGFASSQSQPLVDLEWSSIIAAMRAMTLELGLRFLCDYLSGDVYFRTIYPEQNLHRAQQQFRLQQRIEASESILQSRIEQLMKDA